MTEQAPRHQISRVRREPRRRSLTVTASERLSPHYLRLRFSSPELGDFESSATDDHIKLFVPDGAGGVAMRDYTPRAFDTGAKTLVIDFALHDAGPATQWALNAAPGDELQIGGPRGSASVADDFDWYLLIGDETALPAIGRRLEELRPEVPVTVLAAIDSPEDQIPLADRNLLTVHWSSRSEGGDDTARLTALLDTLTLPEGEGYVWIAAEGSVARALRAHLIDVLGHPRAWVKASGYWTIGAVGVHERIED